MADNNEELILNDLIDETNTEETNKRKAEEDETPTEESNKKPKTVSFVEEKPQFHTSIDYDMITLDLLKQCFKHTKLYGTAGKAHNVYMNWNMELFNKLFPDYNYRNTNKKFAIETPWMKNTFGYAPRPTDNGQIDNGFRAETGEFLLEETEEGKAFLKAMKVLDEFSLDFMYQNQKDFQVTGASREETPDENGMFVTRQSVKAHYKGVVRQSTKPEYGNYISIKNKTGNSKYDAIVNVWQKDENGDYKLVTTCLTAEDAYNSETNPNPIIARGQWVKFLFEFDRIFYSNVGNGPYLLSTDIKTQGRNETMESFCPFK